MKAVVAPWQELGDEDLNLSQRLQHGHTYDMFLARNRDRSLELCTEMKLASDRLSTCSMTYIALHCRWQAPFDGPTDIRAGRSVR